ncbi:energy-coupling factor transporter transmembrane component T family protein [Leucobacter aridicollis]|uniref:energy-coupling factor transporter transmembrane component T family protein n=1 Tax=Leucobacter aridicollis TaxID=283878 RepID=UPI000E64BB5D|nr:energy-coupling factor transporter transmembrane protein EcfT [Leucobacter aridicollis]UTX53365.1 energy-coupling factor transporter transmembrane protein EcfT [Leucobacter aridicollis]
MSIASPLGAYITRPGPLHALRPGAKLVGLFAFAIAIIAAPGWIAALVALAIGITLALLAGLRGRDFWRVARAFALIGVPLFVFQTWSSGWERGIEVIADILALIFAASAVTASTRASDMLDTISWALTPLARFGVDTERVSLTFSLAIRMIPTVQDLARDAQQAARARGLDRSLRARTVPLVLRTVSQAQLTGQALAARGIGDAQAP